MLYGGFDGNTSGFLVFFVTGCRILSNTSFPTSHSIHILSLLPYALLFILSASPAFMVLLFRYCCLFKSRWGNLRIIDRSSQSNQPPGGCLWLCIIRYSLYQVRDCLKNGPPLHSICSLANSFVEMRAKWAKKRMRRLRRKRRQMRARAK